MFFLKVKNKSRKIFTIIVKQKWFEKISSPQIIRIYLGVLRTLGFYINFRQLAINVHSYCVLAHASPLSVLKHAINDHFRSYAMG